MKKRTYDSEYTRHIKNAREAAAGTNGLERAEKIYDYFRDETNHPHATHTYKQLMINRCSDHQFAIDLMKNMSDLVASNAVNR